MGSKATSSSSGKPAYICTDDGGPPEHLRQQPSGDGPPKRASYRAMEQRCDTPSNLAGPGSSLGRALGSPIESGTKSASGKRQDPQAHLEFSVCWSQGILHRDVEQDNIPSSQKGGPSLLNL